ncbi:hypothetical protein BRADI_1g58772v3 [Brachypodium distachyon]|uniref:Uncharacterized protein n=1 Tax=Brachypodium distachyon TaxID=15368 RepID=A0A0Q3HE01_BRADI|nr:hypothetical protein BRADI_1g58772v3 [Brachypodium distachyon]
MSQIWVAFSKQGSSKAPPRVTASPSSCFRGGGISKKLRSPARRRAAMGSQARREHADPGGGGSRAEGAEYVEEDVVGQRAEAVIPFLAGAGAGGPELGSLGGGFHSFLDARLH